VRALDFRTNHDDVDGEPHADEPEPERVPCRLDHPSDPWNQIEYKRESPYYEYVPNEEDEDSEEGEEDSEEGEEDSEEGEEDSEEDGEEEEDYGEEDEEGEYY